MSELRIESEPSTVLQMSYAAQTTHGNQTIESQRGLLGLVKPDAPVYASADPNAAEVKRIRSGKV